MSRVPEPITRDQEYYHAILTELKRIRLLLEAGSREPGDPSTTCTKCDRTFANERALRVHMRVHDKEE